MGQRVKLSIDTARMHVLTHALQTFAKKGIPFAARNALNTTAFEARTEWVGQLGQKLTLRNKYTARSLRVNKASGTNTAIMQSEVGSVLPYMETQEFGGTETKRGKHGVPIPTTTAAGQGLKARPRTRSVRKKNYLGALNVQQRVSGRRQRQNAVAIAMAAKAGGGTVYLDLGRRKGLFSITGTKRGLKVRMLYDLSRARVVTKPRPTLQPTLRAIQPRLTKIWIGALQEQLRRNRVLWY